MVGWDKLSLHRFCLVTIMVGFMVATLVPAFAVSRIAAAEIDEQFYEEREALLRNADDMVAHGGMGDAKAIIHHCEMAVRQAESLIKQVLASHPDREATVVPLNEVIRHCKRVSEIGEQADPGVLLNPAIKARAAARSAIRSLRGIQ
ncbi:MAG: hypothetical protein AB7P24_15560 [Nitrospira sp.]